MAASETASGSRLDRRSKGISKRQQNEKRKTNEKRTKKKKGRKKKEHALTVLEGTLLKETSAYKQGNSNTDYPIRLAD
jgi:hypothetical protein